MDFASFFEAGFDGHASPFPYQRALAELPWPETMSIPTGIGKTAAVVLAWAYKRAMGDSQTPRRLVYCLPMRVLVEQTAKVAASWFSSLEEAGLIAVAPGIHVLMGGELDNSWDINPDQDALIIGTQDQLLSRALNRGYGMSRFRWPVHFALLNNDCLWVLDEVQLMGIGLTTSAQLQAFRDKLGTLLPVSSLWMSATLNPTWLRTVDFAMRADNLTSLELSEGDRRTEQVARRFQAAKPLERAELDPLDNNAVAELVLKAHRPGTRTLVIKNTVKQAQELYECLAKAKLDANLVLLHSRYRPRDRTAALERLLAEPKEAGTICVSTQVVEAGVDVSSSTLISDLAPWASMVQRFGRCNRDGTLDDARVCWLKPDLSKKKATAPYEPEGLRDSMVMLEGLRDVGPQNLPSFTAGAVEGQTIRKKDLVDLFDTTPDLAGSDIDISRYIRETADLDLQVFWRDLPEESDLQDQDAPSREELCSVPVQDLAAMREKGLAFWAWDHLEAAWVRPGNLHPGMTVMLPARGGGYSRELGWTGDKKHIPEVLPTLSAKPDSDKGDSTAETVWQSLADHTNAVVRELEAILEAVTPEALAWEGVLLAAARWHDAGKAHEVYQGAMTAEAESPDIETTWAKRGGGRIIYKRNGFRHELASALAMLEEGLPDLAAYLAAAHHGKVRLSIRSLPHEDRPEEPDRRFARGIWDGDRLPQADLGGNVRLSPMEMDLSYMELGQGPKGASWTGRMLELRDDPTLGPFRLAMLEALLRVADWRGSRREG